MTQDEIIEMAKQASFTENSGFKGCFVCNPLSLEAFAKLVAEKVNADWSETNERLIKVFNEKADLAYLSGAKEEREACAKVCEDSWMAFSRTPNRRLDITPFPELEYVAKVIRARGQA